MLNLPAGKACSFLQRGRDCVKILINLEVPQGRYKIVKIPIPTTSGQDDVLNTNKNER